MTKPRKLPPGMRQLPSGNIRWEKMADGRRFSGTCRTVTEARAAQAAVITDTQRGGIVDPSTVTVGEYLVQWLESKEKTRSQTSTDIQRLLLARYIQPGIGDRRLQKLTPAEARRFFTGLRSLKDPAQPLGATSQRQIHQFLRQAFQDALRDELVTRNVFDVVRPEKQRRELDEAEKVDAYTPAETQAFLRIAESDPRSWWAAFAIATGLRRGELCGLRWVDVDWQRATVSVRENVVEDAGRVRVSATKTAGSRRTVYLPPYAVELLRRQQEHQALMAQMLVPGKMAGHAGARKRVWQDSGRVWTNSSGGIMAPGNLRRSMERTYTAAQVRALHIHGLRHTYASLALAAGVPLEVVSKQLGHSDPGFTLRVYRTVFGDERARWAVDMPALLGQSAGAITHELRTGEEQAH